MLRGLRNASSNWLGKTVMAAVVGFLVISFAIWGIGDIFRGFGRSTVAKIGRTEITDRAVPHPLQRAAAAICAAARPPDQRRPGARDRAGQDGDRADGLGDRARRTRPRARSRAFRCRGLPSRSPPIPAFLGPERPVRPLPFRADHPQCRLHRGALRCRAAPPDAAPPARRHHRVRIERAEGPGRGGQPLPERAALDRICARSTAPRPARFPRPRRKSSPNISRSARSCSARPNTASS